ncbi:MAG: carbohydrate porin [Myxococcota bacterium]|nr:carbohydrate porin [Myxococcota bacterium]
MKYPTHYFLGLLLFFGALPAHAYESEFTFGSYGRVGLSTDEGLARPERRQITSVGPRLIQNNYLELDLGMGWRPNKIGDVAVKTTVAYLDRLPHETADFDSRIAVRQAFLSVEGIAGTGFFTWLGSRMARGDDIYLLDTWVMDDLNIVGLGTGWRNPSMDASLILGLNQPMRRDVVQRIATPNVGFGEAITTDLNRQRAIVAPMVEKRYGGTKGALGMKVRLYSEIHYLPAGERRLETVGDTEPLPDDRGFLLGAQFGIWNFARNGHLNVWARYASGLAAYDELQQPYGLNRDRRADDAREFRLAFSGNYETDRFGLMFGSYFRVFRDADANEEDFDDRQEWVTAVRALYFRGVFTPGIEASSQMLRTNGLNPQTDEQSTAFIHQVALIPALSFGPSQGSYNRPQLQFIAAMTSMNQAALDLFPVDDQRSKDSLSWYFGLRAEWWFGRGGGY